MLLKIGSQKRPDTVVGRLLDCHDRIRSFAAMGRRLAEAQNASSNEIADTAEKIRRYFEEALPRHVMDEEESLMPRLRGRDGALDEALQHMHDQHDAHVPVISAVLTTCQTLIRSPDRHAELKAQLAESAKHLEEALLAHLEEEEAVVLPGIERWLDADTQNKIVEEMRSRRPPK